MESFKMTVMCDDIVDTQDSRASGGIYRKRRCSETPTDTSLTPPQKKTTPFGEQLTAPRDVAQHLNNGAETTDNGHYQELEEYQFSLEYFCDEVLYEIFKFLDTWSLMTLMNVSERFQKFVLDRRLWEEIDLSQEPLPLGILEDMLERSHEKTRSLKIRGPSPSGHIDGEIRRFNRTLRHSLRTRCTKLRTLELFSVTLDFNQISFKDFPVTLKRLVLSNCHARLSANRSSFTGVDMILVNLEELAIEQNAWFDPYFVMTISKLPILRCLSLKGCSQMQQFIPYGSIAGRHGFKQLEILDLRDTPLNDADLQCFNAVETLKEIYLQCPEEDIKAQEKIPSDNATATNSTSEQPGSDGEQPSTSSSAQVAAVNGSTSQATDTSNSMKADENPSTSTSASKHPVGSPSSESPSTSTKPSTSTLPSTSSSSSQPSTSASVPSDATAQPSTSASNNAPENAIVGANTPTRSRFLPRPDHIIYLDCRNRSSPNGFHISLRDRNNLRESRMAFHRQQVLHHHSPAFEHMSRHNLFWGFINPLGRAAVAGGPYRIFGDHNEYEYGGINIHPNPFYIFTSSRARGSISDRGVCCFGRTREPIQHGVISIRFNNRPTENRFERFSVRDYKSVTDTALEHLVQCSPHLVFLDVSGTSVTIKGVQLFKELKPECKVVAEHLLDIVDEDPST